MVFDPVSVPPFPGVDLDAFELHAEMNGVASRHGGHPTLAHDLATLHHVTLMHADFAQMAVDRLQTITVVYDNAVAIDAQGRGIHHLAIVGSQHRHMLRDGK